MFLTVFSPATKWSSRTTFLIFITFCSLFYLRRYFSKKNNRQLCCFNRNTKFTILHHSFLVIRHTFSVELIFNPQTRLKLIWIYFTFIIFHIRKIDIVCVKFSSYYTSNASWGYKLSSKTFIALITSSLLTNLLSSSYFFQVAKGQIWWFH